MGISTLLFCNFELFSFIMQVKKVSQHTINAAICIYLSLGVAWGMAYILLETLAPGSFALEAVIGQVYLTVLVARLVSLNTTQVNQNKE